MVRSGYVLDDVAYMTTITRQFGEFLEREKAGGIILLACTVVSLLLANSPAGGYYLRLWQWAPGGHQPAYWINDGLMTVFFLLIGLELKRELLRGELASRRKALLPAVAAIGGMAVPALLYTLLNYGTPLRGGAGIPVATDIAFSLAVLSLLGKRVPVSLKVFLTAFAVIDDLGAVVVIALFYRGTLSLIHLGLSAGLFILLLVMNRLKVRALSLYVAGGVLLWYGMLHSGIHATLAGVLLAFTMPDGDEHAPAPRLERFLNRPVAFIVLPLFALANTCLVLRGDWFTGLGLTSSIGIMLGLAVGKPLGIVLSSYAAVKTRACQLPAGIDWRLLTGAGMLGGVGFTMSIFIALLAFREPALVDSAKMAILAGSALSGILGYSWLRANAAV